MKDNPELGYESKSPVRKGGKPADVDKLSKPKNEAAVKIENKNPKPHITEKME